MEENVKKLGCVGLDVEPPKIKSILRKGREFLEIQSSSSVHARRASFSQNSGKEGSSLEMTQPSHPHDPRFFAPEFEDRTLEDTLPKERWARRAAWVLAKQVCKIRRSLDDNSVTLLSKKASNSGALDTVRLTVRVKDLDYS